MPAPCAGSGDAHACGLSPGNPLSFGASVSGLLFGRDEGFYYRATGLSIGGRAERSTPAEFSAFIERDWTADVSTTFGLLSANTLPNIVATPGTFVGGRVRIRGTRGEDPNGFRVFSDLRFEAARADSLYGRAALDLTFTQGLSRDASAAVTLAGGSSIGAVPTRLREVGVGMSFLDGLIRFDLARGVYPRKEWRFTGYLDGVL